MNARALCVESDGLRVIAAANGRARCAVFLYRRDDAETLIATESVNLAASRERARFLALVPPEVQDETAPLLQQLAAQVAAASAPRSRAPDTDPFPPVPPWPEAVDAAALLDALADLALRYVVLPPHGPVIFALWTAHTWVPDANDYTPYLLLISPVRECGKSTTLELLAQLVYRPQLSGGITAAALYRRIERRYPTILLDELDTRLRGDGGEALRGVLNTGFHRSGRITICVGDDHEESDFSTFCPKALAGIGRPWDTVESRSIKMQLTRATKSQLVSLTKIRGDRIARECEPYRRKLRRFADDTCTALRNADPMAPTELSARQADVWRPLLAIADFAGGRWPEAARAAARALHSDGQDETDNGLLMLEDVRDLYDRDAVDFLNSTRIADALATLEDRPWPEYRHGQPISTRSVASLLGHFGVKPDQSRITVTDTAGKSKPVRGYARTKLQPVFDTYLHPRETETPIPHDGSGTSGTDGARTAVPLVPLIPVLSGVSHGAVPSTDRAESRVRPDLLAYDDSLCPNDGNYEGR